jgi:glucokinase
MIGVDIGGSGVRAARVVDGVVQGDFHRVDLRDRGIQAVVSAVEQVVAPLGDGPVGVGVPGFVHQGIVLGSPNFPEWQGVNLARILSDRLGRTVRVENDANVAALGAYAEYGGDLVLLTLGTGVGGGVVIGGRLLVGAGGTGAELGHIHVGGTRSCGCGGVGCLEMWCGTVGLSAAARERGLGVVHGEGLAELAGQGDPAAVAIFAEAAEHLGKGLVTLVNVFNPDRIVIAGGLAAARPWFTKAEAWLQRYGVPPSVQRAKVIWGGRAETWAVTGAAGLVANP